MEMGKPNPDQSFETEPRGDLDVPHSSDVGHTTNINITGQPPETGYAPLATIGANEHGHIFIKASAERFEVHGGALHRIKLLGGVATADLGPLTI